MRHTPRPLTLPPRVRRILAEEASKHTAPTIAPSAVVAMVLRGERYPPGWWKKGETSPNRVIITVMHHTWQRLSVEPGTNGVMSLVKIGQMFGYHHTTVMHAVQNLAAG